MPCTCLQSLPIVDGSTVVSAVLHVEHEKGESQEPHAHAEADPVHGLVAHKHVAVDVCLHAGDRRVRSLFTEARDLPEVTGKPRLRFM